MSESNSDDQPTIPDSQSTGQQPTLPPDKADAPELAPTIATSAEQLSGGGLSVGPRSPEPTSAYPQQTGWLENYEILDELGRGGMGVVYKARDRKLDRTVALKMVLGGKFANERDIERFRIEGEAAARLDHPGIIPIYETGQADGNHFFSMKYVDGQSLSQSHSTYCGDVRDAIGMLIKIAEAVQHAHQRGILHRDLKPANILVDQEGNPWVTDLGLAKRMDGDSGLTQTGMVMGTPGFMAPEQAEGRKDMTTATDVFSLGAIMFWMITGKAPFRGENPMDVVLQTLEGETPSIKSLQRSADSDLELICQKAMQRDPEERYHSAAEFAEDLRRWTQGELLSVRAPNAISLASLWVRKNMRTVIASTLTGLLCGLLVGGLILFGELQSIGATEMGLQVLEHQNDSWTRWTASLGSIPPRVGQLLQYALIPVVAACAFLNVLLVRPESREGNIVSGVTAGLVAGLVAFVCSLGWHPLTEHSVMAGSTDIEVLTSAIWMDSDVELEVAREAIYQKYPGLRPLEPRYRQTLLRNKILHDQVTGIPKGMWTGITLSAMWIVFPLSISCVLSGMLWKEGFRSFEWFGMTWERTSYVLLSLLCISLFTQTMWPNPIIALVIECLAILGICFALRQSAWYYRVFVAVAIVCAWYWMITDSGKMYRAYQICATASTDEGLREGAHQFDRFLLRRERQYNRFCVAIIRLYLGEEDRYQEHCDEIMAAFENAYRPEFASRIAKLCLLRPDLQKPRSMLASHHMAKFASASESSIYFHWFCVTRSMSELRQGNFSQARQWAQRCRDHTPNYETYLKETTHLIDAMAWHGESQPERAQTALQQARDDFSKLPSGGYDKSWENRLVFEILEDEAATLIQPPGADSRSESAM